MNSHPTNKRIYESSDCLFRLSYNEQERVMRIYVVNMKTHTTASNRYRCVYKAILIIPLVNR